MSVLKQNKDKNYYTEAYRPQFHFTPEKNWMNDPNGLVYYEGEYHLFYQYHPDGLKWGPMHWGHAVSKDMLHWEHLPIALKPDELGMVFSGSAVVDWHDTSGFFNGGHGLVAIYTSATEEVQQQSIAYSSDNGRTWTTYEGNPVIPNPGIEDFRDPKVLWHDETSQWIMVLAAGQEIMFYGSPNLKNWTHLSNFGEGEGSHDGVWECPDLFELSIENDSKGETRWVLQVDVQDGANAGGSGGQYFVGQFDGKAFKNEDKPERVRWVDYGKDFYATQSFSDIPKTDGRRIWLAWMSNWQYANEVPTDPWRSAMSLPREVTLQKGEDGDIILIQKPIKEIENLENETFVDKTHRVNKGEEVIITSQPNEPFMLEVEVDISADNTSGIRLFDTKENEAAAITLDRKNAKLTIDRAEMFNGHFHKEFPAKTTAPLPSLAGKVDLQIIVDKGSIEVFLENGKITLTNLVLPKQNSDFVISAFAEKEDVNLHITGKTLKSVWV
ncbi:glycoside hydrolase family 32 protein [Bacillus shivajii]|uniref:glycoside hydrolase family 32 protein n=1 Tax=Bacillus shivajii TaxID=1983719 RepID=UPI001CFBDB5A|nr:glycoside hydrolase family 32 protein [Bacillus shivajii]UCZ53902.1 glycoside hydrolase family 32 protein [Bacillus shivajii]